MRESRLAASLDHPHILPIFDAGEIEGKPFLAMRYVDGSPLDLLLRRDGPLDAARAIRLVGQVASGLDAAHAAGLIHRDVKPANILVAVTSNGEHAYLSDFGVSRELEGAAEVTNAGEIVGTVDYVAPEHVEGQPADHRADVYSLACVLYELLTGIPPFRRDTAVAGLFAHVHAPRPSVRDVRADLPQELDHALQRGMAVDPAQRFGTCGELARSAALALEGVTLLADSSDGDALRAEHLQSQPTDVIRVPPMAVPVASPQDPEPAVVSRAAPPVGAQPTIITRHEREAPIPHIDDAPPSRAPAPQRDRRAPLAIAAIAVLILALALAAAFAAMPRSAAAPGPSPTLGGTDDGGGLAGVTCEARQLSAPESGRWRLWRTEYGNRGRGDYLRLKLRREGDHEGTAGAIVHVVPIDGVRPQFDVDPPGSGEMAVVIAFNGPVGIGGGWEENPGYGTLRGFRISRGREGNVHAVATVNGTGCFTLSGGAWADGESGSDADITLELTRD